MNIFQQFVEYLNSRGFQNDAEEDIEEHESKEAAFAREMAALLEKYGIELEEEEDDTQNDTRRDDYDNESRITEDKRRVAEDFKKKEEADDTAQKAAADRKIEKDELKENKDVKEEYGNSSDFDYFKNQYNKTVKAAPAITFKTVEEQRQLGKEIF